MESDKTGVQKLEDGNEEEEEDDDLIIKEKGIRSEEEEDVIMKELRNVKRQNRITHCLLTAMIVVTLTWQVSEVSLILKIKRGLKNPFKSLREMVMKKMLPIPKPKTLPGGSGDAESDGEDHSHPLKLPDLSYLGFNTSDDD